MPPWDTYIQLLCRDTAPHTVYNAVTCHFMHACELNLSLILCAHVQLKGERATVKSAPGAVTGC